MEILGYGEGTHKVRRTTGVIAGALMLVAAHTASAQTNPAGSATDQAPSEAARRAALSPFRFILQNATAPARKPAPAPAKPAAEAPAVAEPKRPAPPVQQAAAQPSLASPAPPPPASESVAVPASAPAPEPAVAALSRPPIEPPPSRREIIPIRVDKPQVSTSYMRESAQGKVRVQFEIQPDGSVSDAKVLSSSNRSLNRPTIDAVRTWKFEPVDEVLTVETEVVYTTEN